MPLTVHPHLVIHHRSLFKTTGGHFYKPLRSEAKFIKWAHASAKDHNSFNSLPSESSTVPQCHSVNFSEWEKTLFSEYWSWGEGTKCKRFDQIDLLSRSSAGVWISLSWGSMGGTGNLHALVCVIVRGGGAKWIINHPFRPHSAGNSLLLHHVCPPQALHSSRCLTGLPLILIRTPRSRRCTHHKSP